jgi:hypothetical protein
MDRAAEDKAWATSSTVQSLRDRGGANGPAVAGFETCVGGMDHSTSPMAGRESTYSGQFVTMVTLPLFLACSFPSLMSL